MVAFKLFFGLALLSVAFAAVPQFPRATVNLTGDGLDLEGHNNVRDRVGKPFLLTCTFDPTLPKDDTHIWVL